MASTYYSLITTLGQGKLAAAAANGTPLSLTELAVGDGNGAEYDPTEGQTALLNEVWRGPLSSVTQDAVNPNWFIAEAVIPYNVGGWTLREAGLFDSAGQMIAIAKFPPSYKPIASAGATKDLVVRLVFEVSNAAGVTLNVDPSVAVLTLEAGDARYVNVTGDTMTGPLALSGDPAQPLEAVPKQYLDARVPAAIPALQPGRYLSNDGTAMQWKDPTEASLLYALLLT